MTDNTMIIAGLIIFGIVFNASIALFIHWDLGKQEKQKNNTEK